MLSCSSGTALRSTPPQSNTTYNGSFRQRQLTVRVVSDYTTDPPSAWPKRAVVPQHTPKPAEPKVLQNPQLIFTSI